MSNIGQFVGGAIKSVQRGTIMILYSATSGTATITAVGDNSELRFLGYTRNSGTPTRDVKIVKTNATTLTASVGTADGSSEHYASFEITDYY